MNKGRELIKRVSLISLVISALVILVIPVFDHEKKEDDITAPSSSVDYKRINVRQSDGTFPGLNDPISTTTSTDTSWNGSCVYLGEYDGNPITWHVLDAYTTDYNTEGKSTIFMYASRSVTEGKSFDFNNNSNWSISSLHNFLNGTDSSSFLNKFTNFEQNLIIPSTKTVIGTGHSMPTIDGKDAVYAPLKTHVSLGLP